MSDELAVQQVLARYVRAHDRRDAAGTAALFTPQGRAKIFYNNGGELEPLGELVGREAIANAVVHMMTPHPRRTHMARRARSPRSSRATTARILFA
jgi:uncharacterized protein (TIGR02246 family)